MARDLQERIKKLIVDRRLTSGSPLPTEPELMELLGASRNSVREALKALQAIAIVEIRHGFGTFVGPMSVAPMIEGLAFRTVAGHHRGEDSLLQLLDLREAVETGLITRLAGRMPATDLAELDALVDRMGREAGSGAVAADTDRAFHATLYRGLRNPLLGEVLEAFREAFRRVHADLADAPADPEVICRQHREILDAVRSGDAVRAQQAVRNHFGHIRARLGPSGASAGPEDSTPDPKRPNDQ